MRKYLVHWDGCDADDATFETYDVFIQTGLDGEPEINADVEREIAGCDAVTDDELCVCDGMLESMRRALSCELAVRSRVLTDRGDDGWAAGTVVAAPRGGETVSVQMDGEAAPALFPRHSLYAVEPARDRDVGDRVRIAWDDDAAPLTKRRWYYGQIVRVDEHKELVSVDFDNGEKMVLQPFFEFELVAPSSSATSAPARPAKRARRG